MSEETGSHGIAQHFPSKTFKGVTRYLKKAELPYWTSTAMVHYCWGDCLDLS